MNPREEETTHEELLARLTRLEAENAQQKEVNAQLAGEVASLRSERASLSAAVEAHQSSVIQEQSMESDRRKPVDRRSSRRNVLRKGLTVAASVIGAGAVLEISSGTAHGHSLAPADNPGNFSSSVSSIPAITAIGTNGADGIDVTSTNRAVYAITLGGVPAIEGVSNSNGFGVSGSSVSAFGVVGTSESGTGVYANSNSGPALVAAGGSGPALVANGLVQVIGNAVGQATLAAGQKSVTVTTSAATTSSNVLLTPMSRLKLPVWVTLASGSFTINISQAPTSSITFAYLIIN